MQAPDWYPLQLQVLQEGMIILRMEWLQQRADRAPTEDVPWLRLVASGSYKKKGG